MAFPATGGAREHLDDVLSRSRAQARTVKGQAQDMRDRTAAGSVTARSVVDLADTLTTAHERFSAMAAVPGIGAYAREQYQDTGLDIGAEFAAMLSAISNVVVWVSVNVPKDASGWLLLEKLTSGHWENRLLTPAQTAGLRTQLDGLIATID